MHEAFCCPVLTFMCMCLCLFFLVLVFFFLLISNCLYNVCSVLLDQEFVLLYYTMYVES